jgi:hypothetical protein
MYFPSFSSRSWKQFCLESCNASGRFSADFVDSDDVDISCREDASSEPGLRTWWAEGIDGSKAHGTINLPETQQRSIIPSSLTIKTSQTPPTTQRAIVFKMQTLSGLMIAHTPKQHQDKTEPQRQSAVDAHDNGNASADAKDTRRSSVAKAFPRVFGHNGNIWAWIFGVMICEVLLMWYPFWFQALHKNTNTIMNSYFSCTNINLNATISAESLILLPPLSQLQ